MAGYSGRPLIKKLGIKTGLRIAIINPPEVAAIDEIWAGLKFVYRVADRM